MSKRFLLVPVFVILAILQVKAQDGTTIDSLQRVIRSHPMDTTGVETLIMLAGEYYMDDPGKAEATCRQALAVSQQIGYEKGITASYGWLGFLLEQRGAVDSALFLYNRAILIDRRIGNKKELSQLYNNVAAIYKDRGRIVEALELYKKALVLSKQINRPETMPAPLNNIGLIYQNQGQYELAMIYYERSLEIEDSLKNKDGVATSLYNIATVHKDLGHYNEALDVAGKVLKAEIETNDKYQQGTTINFIGTVYQLQGKNDEALGKFRESLLIRESIDDKQGKAYTLRNMGAVYEQMDSLTLAAAYYQQSIDIFRGLENSWGEATVLCKLGELSLRMGNKDAALKDGLRSLELARELGYPIDIRNAAGLLQKVHRAMNNYSEALEMYDLYVRMQDSVRNDEARKSVIKAQMKFEFEKEKSEIKAEQEKRNALNDERVKRETLLRNFFIGGFVLLLILAGLLFNRYKIKTASNRELELKNRIISDEKDRSEKLLLNILPAEVAAELKENGSAKARSFGHVTVLFSDFKDFTKVSELLSPEDLVREIDYCFSAFDRIIEKYGIEKIKTVGDAYMAVCGMPQVNPDHARLVVEAALEMRDFISVYHSERTAKGLPAFQVRIGINTGPVVAGIVGIKKFAYDVWGDTVNLASRMESNGQAGKVNISASTYDLVRTHFNCEYRGHVKAKNKGEVEMYFAERI